MVYINHVVTTIVESVDVNVTPDKRQIFMENEKILLATIKVSTADCKMFGFKKKKLILRIITTFFLFLLIDFLDKDL